MENDFLLTHKIIYVKLAKCKKGRLKKKKKTKLHGNFVRCSKERNETERRGVNKENMLSVCNLSHFKHNSISAMKGDTAFN